MPNGNFLFDSASITLVYELRVIAVVMLHLNATYFAEHPALKSVDEKSN